MSTPVTSTNNPVVEYHGVAHIPSMTQELSDCDREVLHKSANEVIVEQKQKTGRPVSLTEAYKYILERDGALPYAEVIAKDAKEAKNARDRLSAAQEMEDRASGKAVQNIRHAGVFMVMAPGAEALQALDAWSDDE